VLLQWWNLVLLRVLEVHGGEFSLWYSSQTLARCGENDEAHRNAPTIENGCTFYLHFRQTFCNLNSL
jgi:hypothetical protein